MSNQLSSENMFPASEPGLDGPRWFMLEQPRIQGLATFEWNMVAGTLWFSEEWENIIQSPYDWTRPSDQKWWSARVHPEDKVRFQRSLLAVHAGLLEAHDLLCRLKRGNGTWMQALLRSRVTHKTAAGGPWIVAGLLIDLTGVPLAGKNTPTDALTFSSHEYHSMLENSPDLFIRFNRDLLPIYVNPSVCRFLGGARAGRAFSQEEAQARRIAGTRQALFRNGVCRVFAEQAVVREELTLPMTDGSEIVGDCSFWPEFDPAGEVRYCMVQLRDITDKRRREQDHQCLVRELQQAKNKAEAANTAKNAFLATVSHELRTPLNGILGMLQLIESLPLAEEQQKYLQTARDSGKSLSRIISDILDYSSMESGTMPLAHEAFDPRASVCSALAPFFENAKAKGLKLTLILDPAIPPLLLGDEGRVRQILTNIVSNALKFTANGSISILCSRFGKAPPGQVNLIIEVRDTGIGIPQEKLAGVFDAFSQIENSSCRKYAGTGLGLSIVKHLVALMNGSISIESELGHGATVRIFLSFAEASATPRQTMAPTPAKPASAAQSLDILVAEDDAVSSMTIQKFLQRKGCRVLCVQDGRKALQALQLYPFHGLFTDIAMPEMDGLELVRRIRTGDTAGHPPTDDIRSRVREAFPGNVKKETGPHPDIPIIAVSAQSMMGDRERFLAQGMDYYVSKPLDKDEIDAALAIITRSR